MQRITAKNDAIRIPAVKGFPNMANPAQKEHVPKRFVIDFNMHLLSNGFSSTWMREFFPEDTESKFDRIFLMFQRLGFSGEEAAVAIKEATGEFQRNKQEAKKNGWPLKYPATLTEDFTKPEAYFIEQLASTVMEMRRHMAQTTAV